MKISKLHIDGFGVWTNLDLENVSDQATVFFGHNEAGKTTLMQFVRTVLYGFSAERRTRYLPPLYGGLAGGSLRIEGPHGRFTARRRPDGPHESGALELLSGEGLPQDPKLMSLMLAGIDESTFNNVFAVGLREIQELGALDDTEAADQLYKLTSGLDRVSLVDVMRDLAAARNRLLSPDDRPSTIAQLLSQRERLQTDIEELVEQGRRYARLAAHRKSLEADVDELQLDIAEMERQTRSVEVALLVREKWRQRRATQEEIDRIGALPDLSGCSVEKLDALNSDLGQQRRHYEQLKEQRKQLRERSAGVKINTSLVGAAARIEAYGEHQPWLENLGRQISDLEVELLAVEEELKQHGEQLKLDDGAPLELPELAPRTLAVLKTPAKSLRMEQRKLRIYKKQRDDSRLAADELHKKVHVGLKDLGENDVSAALEKWGERVALMRKHQQLEQRLEQLGMSRDDLDEESQLGAEDRLQPFQVMAVVGGATVLGGGLILWAMIFYALAWIRDVNTALWLGWFGVIFLLMAKIVDYAYQQSLVKHTSTCGTQLEVVRGQIDETRRERDHLEAQLPPGGGPIEQRLRAGEQVLRKLEELAPLDAKRKAELEKSQLAQKKTNEATESIKHALAKWKGALRAAGLPDDLSPQRLGELGEHHEYASDLRRRLGQLKNDLNERRKEYDGLAHKIRQLVDESGVKTPLSSAPEQLRMLQQALHEQRKYVEQREVLSDQEQQLKRELSKTASTLRKLRRRRQALIAAAGAIDEKQFRQRRARYDHWVQLQKSRDELSRDITHLIAGKCPESEVAQEFAGGAEATIEQRYAAAQTRVDDLQRRLAELHGRRGEMIQEMKTLRGDRKLAGVLLELSSVEARLQAAVREWRTLATACILLESIRQIYETQRQPLTLAEGSRYLRDLTDGKYQRIWTPLGEHALRVDDEEGRTLPLDVLSSGTREAVFLSLRLALADIFARRGAVLPLVLDDVLVNFDSGRARAAAKVLRNFARAGRQLLIFTCHEHIMQLFRSLDVEVRVLPEHAVVAGVRKPAELPRPEPIPEPPYNPEPEIVEINLPPEPAPQPEPAPEVEFALAPPEPVVEPSIELPEPEPVTDEREYELARAHGAQADEYARELLRRYANMPAPAPPAPPPKVEKSAKPKPEKPRRERSSGLVEEYTPQIELSPPPAPPPRRSLEPAPHRRRFTWDDPEVWWEADQYEEGEAA